MDDTGRMGWGRHLYRLDDGRCWATDKINVVGLMIDVGQICKKLPFVQSEGQLHIYKVG